MPDPLVAGLSTRRQLIFVVESDFEVGTLICHSLQMQGFVIRWFREPSEVVAEASKNRPALFVLDAVSGKSSFELCRQIRQTRGLGASRILFLTSKTRKWDGISALELGGDAYVTKPVNPRELAARVRTVLRQTIEPELVRVAKFGGIEIDSLSMTIRVDGRAIRTTMREFRLLQYLAHHAARVFTRGQLLDAVWAEGAFVTQRSVDVYMRRLREKIEPDPRNPIYLISVRGVGYRFDVPR
jgi:two-component system phosphate regulon response regulator PhoB